MFFSIELRPRTLVEMNGVKLFVILSKLCTGLPITFFEP
jgi:hypothetical protein